MKPILFSLILIVTYTFSFAQKSTNERKLEKCLIDKWAFEFYAKPSFLGFKEAPVEIISIWNPEFEEGDLNELELRNLSGKTVTDVKIKWFIYRLYKTNDISVQRENPTIIIQKETAKTEIGEFNPNEKKNVRFPLGRPCQEIYNALVKYDKPEGKLWIEHTISEITYADGSKWTR